MRLGQLAGTLFVMMAGIVGSTATGHALSTGPSLAPAAASAPRLLDQVGGATTRVAVDGDVAFVMNGPRILAYRASPSGGAPRLVGRSEPLPGIATDLVASEHRLYAGLQGLGLWILDVREPARPVVVGAVRTYSDMNNVAVLAGFVYIADGAAGLRVVDARDPAHPVSVGTMPVSDRGLDENVTEALYVAIINQHALVFYRDSYSMGELVAVFDLAEPDRPRPVGIVDLGVLCSTQSTAAVGTTLFAVCNYQLYALDVSDPASTRIVGQARIPNVNAGYIAVTGHYAVIGSAGYSPADGLGVAVVDITDVEAMTVVGFLETRAGTVSLAVIDSDVFVSDMSPGIPDGLRQVDIGDPAHPRDVGRAEWLGWVRHVAVNDTQVIVAPTESYLWSLDRSGLAPHQYLAVRCDDIAMADDHLYVAGRSAGLLTFDAGSPGTLAPRAPLPPDLPGLQFERVVVQAGRAFVLAGTGGRRDVPPVSELIVAGVSDPDHPTILGRVNVDPTARYLAVWRNRVFVASGAKVRIIDVSDVAHPADIGGWTTSDAVSGLAVDEDGYVYAAGGHQLRAYDARDAAHTGEVGVINFPAAITALDVAGGRAAVALYYDAVSTIGFVDEFHVIDTRDPRRMTDQGAVGVPGVVGDNIGQVQLDGDQAYVAGGAAGLVVLDVPGAQVSRVYLPHVLVR